MTAATVNPSPKSRFLETKGAIEAHHGLIQTESFQRAKDAALLEYQRKLATNLGVSQNAQVEGMVMGWKLAGVQEYLAELLNLAEKPMVAQAPGLSRILNHEAK